MYTCTILTKKVSYLHTIYTRNYLTCLREFSNNTNYFLHGMSYATNSVLFVQYLLWAFIHSFMHCTYKATCTILNRKAYSSLVYLLPVYSFILLCYVYTTVVALAVIIRIYADRECHVHQQMYLYTSIYIDLPWSVASSETK